MGNTMEPAEYDLTVEDQRCHLDEITPEQDLWENHGFLVRGETEDGVDLTLWTSPYIVKRGPHSYYSAEMNILQTLLIAGRFSADEKKRMNDNDFVAVGWCAADYLPFGSIEADRDEERVLWTVGDREYEDSPPHWAVRGKHGGVDLDLSLDAYVPTFNVYAHEGFQKNGIAWYEAYLKAAGSIRHAGESFDFTGHACHERVIVTRDHEPQKMLGRGLNWHHLFADRVQSWIMTSPSAEEGLAYVVVDGKTYPASGPVDVRIDDSGDWIDPRSWLRVPNSWHVTVDTEGGKLELDAHAYARAYYTWTPFRDTVNVLYWMAVEADGKFTGKDGEAISFEGAKYMAHSNRVMFERQAPES